MASLKPARVDAGEQHCQLNRMWFEVHNFHQEGYPRGRLLRLTDQAKSRLNKSAIIVGSACARIVSGVGHAWPRVEVSDRRTPRPPILIDRMDIGQVKIGQWNGVFGSDYGYASD